MHGWNERSPTAGADAPRLELRGNEGQAVMVQAQVQIQSRGTRVVAPERWQRAAERALAEGIQVRQVNASGMWVATSGSDPKVAYLLEITGSLVQSCSCPAGSFGDPCCKHAARYYLDMGLLELDDPEPEPPAPADWVVSFRCRGGNADWPMCHGAGIAPLASQAAALVAAAA